MTINISPQAEAKSTQLAELEGINPSTLVEKLLAKYKSRSIAENTDDVTIDEKFGHLIGQLNFDPTDLGQRDKAYLATGD